MSKYCGRGYRDIKVICPCWPFVARKFVKVINSTYRRIHVYGSSVLPTRAIIVIITKVIQVLFIFCWFYYLLHIVLYNT